MVPPFEIELDASAVAALIPAAARIPVVGAGRERFGSRRTVPVTVLRPSPALTGLHTAIVQALEGAGAVMKDQRHILGAFRAHATDQHGGRLHPGERAVLTELSVVARAPHSRRRVAARVTLAP